jgi:thiosulfate reductase cytochrome b subunit
MTENDTSSPQPATSALPDKPCAALSSDTHKEIIYRHALPIRLTHWINVLCLVVLLMSGLQIFNAHPALYWGNRSDADQALLSIDSEVTDTGALAGVTTVLDHQFDTTGVLGVSRDSYGNIQRRGFPTWSTIPGPQWLAMGRRWHFFFAWVFVINGLIYLLYSLLSRHLTRDLLPSWRELRRIGRSIVDHLLFRHPQGEAAQRYNVLQKISYVFVVFVLLPLTLLTGLTMSPWINAAFPQMLTLFDGRQSARTIHFIVAFSLVAFTLIHVFMVIVTGLWNNLRSMLTGRYTIKHAPERPVDAPSGRSRE